MTMQFKKFEHLPSPPGVAARLLELYGSPDVSIADVTEVIGADPTLSARIITFANSPTFARRHAATSLRQAITMLGVNGVKMIALSFSLTDISRPREKGKRFSFEQFWSSSLATATCARSIFKVQNLDDETGFLLGLLMNVGQLAMYCSESEKYEAILGDLPCFDLEMIERESAEFGQSRLSMIGDVLEAWNFPESLCDELKKLADKDVEHGVEATSLLLANKMSYLFMVDAPDPEIVAEVAQQLSALATDDEDAGRSLYGSTLETYAELAQILSYESPILKSLEQIEQVARESILQMTMDLHLANSQVRAENNELRDMAFVDTLTGLGNRRQYESVVGAELERCSRMSRTLALVVVDIDHFKKVNDTWGHSAGDTILAGVAKRFERGLRGYDFLFRIGGEEFVLIQPEATAETCMTVCDRLRQSIEAEPFEFEEHQIPVTVSFGCSIFDPSKPETLESLFDSADKALYRAKESGRNRCELAGVESAETVAANGAGQSQEQTELPSPPTSGATLAEPAAAVR